MWENLNIALKSLNGIILLIIYLRSTTGLTDTIINELSGSFIESGIPIIQYSPHRDLFFINIIPLVIFVCNVLGYSCLCQSFVPLLYKNFPLVVSLLG